MRAAFVEQLMIRQQPIWGKGMPPLALEFDRLRESAIKQGAP